MCLTLALPLAGLAVVRGRGSPRSYIASHYIRVVSAGQDAAYTSSKPPGLVAAEISRAWRPAQRLAVPGGYFLRYSNLIIAITPNAGGGSRITVDDERRGYSRWYGHIGSRWGTYRGPAETVRGGGPGAGK